jgi:hypothetical protein
VANIVETANFELRKIDPVNRAVHHRHNLHAHTEGEERDFSFDLDVTERAGV